MSDDGEFNVLIKSLTRHFERRAAVQRLVRFFSVALPGLVLLVLAVFLVLTDTAIFLITLLVVLTIIFEILRVGLWERETSRAGEQLG